MATTLEAAPFIDRLKLVLESEKPFAIYRKENVILILSGIGKGNAAIATTYTILTYKPARICNLGAAGAVKPGFKLGETCHINSVIEYDRPHLRSEKMRTITPQVLPGFRCATVATQDKPVVDQSERKAIGACTDLVDMEAAGIVQASQKFFVDCILFKFVSDTVDHDTHDDIITHIKAYREAFCDYVMQEVLPVLSRMN